MGKLIGVSGLKLLGAILATASAHGSPCSEVSQAILENRETLNELIDAGYVRIEVDGIIRVNKPVLQILQDAGFVHEFKYGSKVSQQPDEHSEMKKDKWV